MKTYAQAPRILRVERKNVVSIFSEDSKRATKNVYFQILSKTSDNINREEYKHFYKIGPSLITMPDKTIKDQSNYLTFDVTNQENFSENTPEGSVSQNYMCTSSGNVFGIRMWENFDITLTSPKNEYSTIAYLGINDSIISSLQCSFIANRENPSRAETFLDLGMGGIPYGPGDRLFIIFFPSHFQDKATFSFELIISEKI